MKQAARDRILKDCRAHFVSEMNQWRIEKRHADSALLSDSLKDVLINGYDAMMKAAIEISTLDAGKGKTYEETHRYQHRHSMEAALFYTKLLKCEEIRGKRCSPEGIAQQLLGATIKAVCAHAYEVSINMDVDDKQPFDLATILQIAQVQHVPNRH